MKSTDILSQLTAISNPQKAAEMAAYHKSTRQFLGVANPVLNDFAADIRRTIKDMDSRVRMASELWNTDIHEARVLAAKSLTQARLRPDDAVWDLICSWLPDFDGWAIADHACMAGQRRLTADLSRIDQIEHWTASDHMWTRRAAMVISLPLAKKPNPKPADIEGRERVLGWAARYVSDPDWFIQKSVAWWVRDMSKHDADRARQFISEHGDGMKAFARKEAGKYLSR